MFKKFLTVLAILLVVSGCSSNVTKKEMIRTSLEGVALLSKTRISGKVEIIENYSGVQEEGELLMDTKINRKKSKLESNFILKYDGLENKSNIYSDEGIFILSEDDNLDFPYRTISLEDLKRVDLAFSMAIDEGFSEILDIFIENINDSDIDLLKKQTLSTEQGDLKGNKLSVSINNNDFKKIWADSYIKIEKIKSDAKIKVYEERLYDLTNNLTKAREDYIGDYEKMYENTVLAYKRDIKNSLDSDVAEDYKLRLKKAEERYEFFLESADLSFEDYLESDKDQIQYILEREKDIDYESLYDDVIEEFNNTKVESTFEFLINKKNELIGLSSNIVFKDKAYKPEKREFKLDVIIEKMSNNFKFDIPILTEDNHLNVEYYYNDDYSILNDVFQNIID